MSPLPALDLLLVALAAFRLTRLLVIDRIALPIRRPFVAIVETQDAHGAPVRVAAPRGTRLRALVGEILSCTWCAGIWVTAGLLAALHLWPGPARLIIQLLAIAGAAGLCEAFVGVMEARRRLPAVATSASARPAAAP